MARSLLTLRRLNAMCGAVESMLAGPGPGEGDWPEGVSWADMEAASAWIKQEIDKREPSQ